MPPGGLRRTFLLPGILLIMATADRTTTAAGSSEAPGGATSPSAGPFRPLLSWLHKRARNSSSSMSSPPLAFASSPPPPNVAPTHVCVLVHGYVGTPRDLTYLKEAIERLGKGDTKVHMATSNDGQTRDGVRKGGSRLADEVRDVVSQHPSLKRISIVGNSLGGLYARYAISVLYEPNGRTIAGLQPQTFLTIASPHLGVRKYLGFPVPDPLHFLAPVFVGKSGADLFLRDKGEEDGEEKEEKKDMPLLLKMATDPKFIEPLAAFKYRRAYANVQRDLLVPMGTAAFNLPSQKITATKALSFPDEEVSLDIIKIPRLASSSSPSSSSVSARLLSTASAMMMTTTIPSKKDMEDFMAEKLNQLGWTKVLVDFRDVVPRAHNMICALSRDPITSFLYRRGRPVMDHAASFLIDPRDEDQDEGGRGVRAKRETEE